ncbi:MAG: nucleotide sugar dehydrogenase [candidate division FCPU426 bacterium]
MKVCVHGLWHLGSVTAACMAKAGHQVTALEPDAVNRVRLGQGQAPLHEPGLDALLQQGLDSGALCLEADPAKALRGSQVLWICFDTPLDAEDRADTGFVLGKVRACLPLLDPQTLILLSSQLPVGSAAVLQAEVTRSRPEAGIRVACCPENLRLGQALAAFQNPERVVLGVSDEASRAVLEELFRPLSVKLEWMSVASAEMVKHAINSFLALSIVFINEIAQLCEKTGADAVEVERGLKSDGRIGAKARLSPGPAFSGGTLARDLEFLGASATKAGLDPAFFDGVLLSNNLHRDWPLKKLEAALGDLSGRKIGVLGLAYKSGTDTLRSSQPLAWCRTLLSQGAEVSAFDPLIKAVPEDLSKLRLSAGLSELLGSCEALLIAQPWPGLKEAMLALQNSGPCVVVDPSGLLADTKMPLNTRYFRVGKA